MLTYMEVGFLFMYFITIYSVVLAIHYYRKLMRIYEKKEAKGNGKR